MKIGETWRYKKWLAKSIDENLPEYIDVGEVRNEFSTYSIRVVITDIVESGEDDIVWFREINTNDEEYSMSRKAFLQVFEKDWNNESGRNLEA